MEPGGTNKDLADRFGSITTTHPEYDANLPMWIKCRDVLLGTDQIKSKGTTYLPQLSGQNTDAYNAYKARAVFYPAVKRTIRGMAGMVFMKEVEVENLPDSLSDLEEDVTLTGVPLSGFAKSIFHEVMGLGRAGILVDMPEEGAKEMRPYLVEYEAEQVVNWRRERIGGTMMTTLVVLSETYEEDDPTDTFKVQTGRQYRVLQLLWEDEEGNVFGTPRYRMRVFREREWVVEGTTKKVTAWYIYHEVWPVRNGRYLEEIPFIVIGAEEVSWSIQVSPVEDMADVVLSHYRSSADLENGRHWCGIPQPWLAGFPTDDGTVWKIGGDQIWQSSDPSARAGMLEFSGQGLQPLENALKEKEDKLAVLGMRLLESQKRTAEQPEALRLRMLSDVSTLQSVVRTISQGISRALNIAAAWMASGTIEAVVALNLDYDETILNAQDLTALVGLWQSDGISYKTLYHNLKKGEITRDGVDEEQEQKDIQEEREKQEEINKRLFPDLPTNPPPVGDGTGEEDEGDEDFPPRQRTA